MPNVRRCELLPTDSDVHVRFVEGLGALVFLRAQMTKARGHPYMGWA